jgi:hypothetical protein
LTNNAYVGIICGDNEIACLCGKLFVIRAPYKRLRWSNPPDKGDALKPALGASNGRKELILSPMLYKLHQFIAIAMLLISPARIVATLPIMIPAVTQAHASVETAPYKLTLDTRTAQAVSAPVKKVPDFDSDVAAPLKAAQADATAKAKRAALSQRLAAQKAVVAVKAPAAVSAELLAQLRYCEAGGIYTRNSGNGYYGAYQYNLGTWANYGGYARPDLAPAEVQDAKAMLDISIRGWSPWPTCARRIGAM